MDGTPEAWEAIATFLHPRRSHQDPWKPKLVLQLLTLADKYDLFAVTEECVSHVRAFQFSASPSNELYVMTWLGYASQYKVGVHVVRYGLQSSSGSSSCSS